MAESVTGLFCFDGPLYKDKNGIYCNLTLTNEMFSRYFRVVDRLILLVRTFVLTKTYLEANLNPLITDRIEVIEVPNFSTVKGFLQKSKFKIEIISALSMARYIFARMPSVTSNEVLKYAIKMKKPYLAEVGGCAWDSYRHHGILGKIIAPKMYFDERKYVYRALFCSYVTDRFLQRRYPNRDPLNTACCSNVYLDDVDNSVLKKRINKIKQSNLRDIVLGQAVNSIDVKYKGEHQIIKILPLLRKAGIRATFQVVGPGKGDYLKNVAKKYGVLDQLVLIGTLSKKELADWYQRIDVYVQPSMQEGLPRSVIEAMSFACPSIGSNIAGIPELLSDSCLFDPKSKKSIFSKLISIICEDRLIRAAEDSFAKSKLYSLERIEDRRNALFDRYKKALSEE